MTDPVVIDSSSSHAAVHSVTSTPRRSSTPPVTVNSSNSMNAVTVNASNSMPETIEHVQSSTASRPSARTSATLELLAAREEHARLELQASAARLALLEAQAEADAMGSTISSTAPVNDNVQPPNPMPAFNMPAPPRDGPGRPILPVNPPNQLPVHRDSESSTS